jgi:TolA-binding protein
MSKHAKVASSASSRTKITTKISITERGPAHKLRDELRRANVQIAELEKKLRAVQTDLDDALQTMEWQRRELARLHVAAAQEGK